MLAFAIQQQQQQKITWKFPFICIRKKIKRNRDAIQRNSKQSSVCSAFHTTDISKGK